MSRQKRRELTLEMKVALIRSSEGKSHRQLADLYGIGRTQVGSILKRKAEFLEAFQGNAQPFKKRFRSAFQYPDIDRLTWEWFQQARQLGVPVSGPLIQEKARMFASLLGHVQFKGSSGWLDSFKCRHSISLSSAVSGVRAAAADDGGIICDWNGKWSDCCDGYEFWNIREATGFMLTAFRDPDQTLGVKDGDYARGN